MKVNCADDWGDPHSAIQSELNTIDGSPLHAIPEVVSYLASCHHDDTDQTQKKKIVDYGPINDIIYAEEESFACVKAKLGACFANHGAVPVSFGKIPTQSLSVMQLNTSSRVDRYRIMLCNHDMRFGRALVGGDEKSSKQVPLFAVEVVGGMDAVLKALTDCQCIFVGSLAAWVAPMATLSKNGTNVIHSFIDVQK